MVVLGGVDPSVGITGHTDTTATGHSHKQLPTHAFTDFFKLVQYLLLLLCHLRLDGIAPQTILHLAHFTVAMS